jgi:hypothetical protein
MSNVPLRSTKLIDVCDYGMTRDEYEKIPPEEKGHFAKCAKCGEMFDRRSLDEVLFHTEHKHRPDIPYSGSVKL